MITVLARHTTAWLIMPVLYAVFFLINFVSAISKLPRVIFRSDSAATAPASTTNASQEAHRSVVELVTWQYRVRDKGNRGRETR